MPDWRGGAVRKALPNELFLFQLALSFTQFGQGLRQLGFKLIDLGDGLRLCLLVCDFFLALYFLERFFQLRLKHRELLGRGRGSDHGYSPVRQAGPVVQSGPVCGQFGPVGAVGEPVIQLACGQNIQRLVVPLIPRQPWVAVGQNGVVVHVCVSVGLMPGQKLVVFGQNTVGVVPP